MNWLLSLIVGLLTAPVGCIGTYFVAERCVRWYRISSFEGAAGYYVVFLSLFGLIAGFVVGVVAARLVAGWEHPGFLKALGLAMGTTSALVLVAGFLAWLAADLPPRLEGRRLELAIEVRTPAGFTLPVEPDPFGAFTTIQLLRRSRSQPPGDLRLGEAWQSDGHWIVPATVPLATSRPNRYLRVYFSADHDVMFRLPLPRRPAAKDLAWSEWIDGSWPAGHPQPPPEARYRLRFRVQPEPLPPPPPDYAALAAEQAAREQAEFEALEPTAPLLEWLRYTRYGTPEERKEEALRRISARPHLAAELGRLMQAEDPELAAEALRLVEHLHDPSPALLAPVGAVGRHLAELIRDFNRTPRAEDPGYLRAAEISVRFSGWMVAVRTLREKSGGDFTRELREILELSRVRDDSIALRGDVRRVASYYLHEWAGVAPLPGDPAPR